MWLKNFMEKTDDKAKYEMEKNKPDAYAELVVPKQKKIGCAAKEANSGHLILNLCLYGPEGDTKSYFEKRGTPGSKCDPGYFSNDGLCSIYVEKKHGSVNGTMEKDENSGSCNFSFLMITVLLSMIMIF